MTLAERITFLDELVENVKQDLIKEAGKYPDSWDGIELRWRTADVFSGVVFGEIGQRKGKRYNNYRNEVLVQ